MMSVNVMNNILDGRTLFKSPREVNVSMVTAATYSHIGIESQYMFLNSQYKTCLFYIVNESLNAYSFLIIILSTMFF